MDLAKYSVLTQGGHVFSASTKLTIFFVCVCGWGAGGVLEGKLNIK